MFLVVPLLALAVLVGSSESSQRSFHDWRHTGTLAGDVRRLDSPVGLRSQAAAVALGDGRVLTWGGRNVSADSGVVYDPATDTWQDLPPAPGPSRFGAAATWTGDEAVIWGGSINTDPFDFEPGGVAYDPRTEQWRTLPPAPVGLFGARALSFDDGVLFTGGSPQSSPGTPVSLWLGEGSGTWTEIPTPVRTVNTTWTDGQLLATGPTAVDPAAIQTGAYAPPGWAVVAFDRETLSWQPFAEPMTTDWAALATADDGTVSMLTLEGLNEPLRAYRRTGLGWEQVAETMSGANGIVTIELEGYPPVTASTGGQLLLGGEGALTGWDPQTLQFAHRADSGFRTFGGSAVWTGSHLVSPTSQAGPGWRFTPTSA